MGLADNIISMGKNGGMPAGIIPDLIKRLSENHSKEDQNNIAKSLSNNHAKWHLKCELKFSMTMVDRAKKAFKRKCAASLNANVSPKKQSTLFT